MDRRDFLKFAGFVVPALSGQGCTGLLSSPKNSKPNVVLFFIDDMGYADIEPFGSKKNRTPNLSQMAGEGVKFTAFYSGWTECSPSRASLLTGCHAGRVSMDGRVCFPNEPKALSPDEYTMADMFKSAGYRTGIFGKWHLGHLPGYLPPSHGFDEYWGIPYSNDMWNKGNKKYPPLAFINNNKPVAIVDDGEDQSLLTRVFTDRALGFIRKNYQKPFFAYIPYSAVHGPRFGHKDFLERVKDKSDYAAQVEEIDASVGEVVSLLKELGIDENTMVLFMSDNGGVKASEKQPLRGRKGRAVYEGHMRTPVLVRWPGRIAGNKVCSENAITVDLLPTFAALCGGKLSENKIDGKDISNLLLDPENGKSPHSVVPYKTEGFRKGKWKLVCVRRRKELYDLENDIREKKDLAEKYPEIVNDLVSELERWKKTLDKEKRPNAQMNPCGPLVTETQAAKLPRLADWMKKTENRH